MNRKCKSCEFISATNGLFCFNCGTFLLPHPSASTLNVIALGIVFFGFYAFGALAGQTKWMNLESFHVLVMAFAVGLMAYLMLFCFTRRAIHNAAKKSLCGHEKRIETHLARLNESQMVLRNTGDLVKGQEEKVGLLARDTLLRAEDSIVQLKQEYQSKLWEIELIRLLNEIEGVRIGMRSDHPDRLTNAARALDAQEASAGERLQIWENDALAISKQGGACIKKLKEVIAFMNSVRQECVLQEVRNAVKGISPLDCHHDVQAISVDLPEEMTVSYRLHTLASELRSLEDENIRLKAEQSVV